IVLNLVNFIKLCDNQTQTNSTILVSDVWRTTMDNGRVKKNHLLGVGKTELDLQMKEYNITREHT
ncbi:hypothetical protein ACJX0J_017058, partial [Zea mays]